MGHRRKQPDALGRPRLLPAVLATLWRPSQRAGHRQGRRFHEARIARHHVGLVVLCVHAGFFGDGVRVHTYADMLRTERRDIR